MNPDDDVLLSDGYLAVKIFDRIEPSRTAIFLLKKKFEETVCT